MATVSLRDVGKRFGALDVMDSVSVDIADGEFIALVGPSGCGKSTLLRMIAGLEEVSWGEICIGSRLVNDVPAKQRNIAMVFQNYALYPHMTVSRNMGFSLRIKRSRPEQIQSQIERASTMLGLQGLLERYPRQLSGGQRQRVAMGRAIVRAPDVFLFDEPLSNLDAKLRVHMRAEIRDLHNRLRTTTIYVTHDQVEAMTMADRIVVMRDGVIEQIGTPADLYDNPANVFVAGFIGSPAMNLLRGEVVETGFRTPDGTSIPVGPLPRQTTTLGVRPEHFRFDPAGVLVRVTLAETTGSETLVIGRLGEQSLVAQFRERLALKSGDQIRLSAIESEVHAFGVDGSTLMKRESPIVRAPALSGHEGSRPERQS
jgi:multiple sugar transport system ATP-binding protein